MKEQNGFNVAELTRMLHNMIQITTITSVDFDNKVFRVRIGEAESNESAELPWPAEIGRNFRRWRPLRTGQQIVIACPSGDPAQAVMIGEIYSDSLPPPCDSPELDVIEYDNGNRIEHDAANGEIRVKAKGNVIVNGDVVADGISLKNHVHKGVTPGKGMTGGPTK